MNYSPLLIPFVKTKRVFRAFYYSLYLPMKTSVLTLLWRFRCGERVRFIGPSVIRAYERDAVQIGSDVTFVSALKQNLVGLLGPTIICAAKGSRIVIGDHSGFSSVVINARKEILIGNHVQVGGNVRIFDHDFHPLAWQDRRPPEKQAMTRAKPVRIDDDVFIGTNAIVLKGTHIGARSIIAAGSVVFGLDIPPDSLVKGNPAVILKQSTK